MKEKTSNTLNIFQPECDILLGSFNLLTSGWLRLATLLLTVALLSIPSAAFAFGLNESPASRLGSNLVCTAGDVSITGIAVAPGTPTSCVGGTTFTADLDVTINFSQPDRWDIGIFLSNDGGDPSILPAGGGASTCSVGILPTSFPFLDLDPHGGLDTCGDGNKAINGGTGAGVVRLTDVPVSCTAIASSGGNLYIPFVVTWDNQASPTGDDCTSIADPTPNTVSKCNAPKISLPTEVQYGTVNAVVLPKISKTDGVLAVDPGDAITYTVVITNTTGQPLSGAVFTDPVTANVTVDTLTCSTSGGFTCPAVTIADMQGLGITIPTIPIGSYVTFTIDASVANPTVPSSSSNISNTANITVSGETNSATDIDNINGAIFSELSTSTKTVVDLNGGEADPGDVLRYTITLIETQGQPVIGASVTDNIPAGVNSFTVVSTPVGSTDSSTGAGTGSNGTGYLNISGVDVAANGSKTIAFDVTIPVGTPSGTLINNTATVTNLGGPGAMPVAPTVPVSPSAVPVTDNKQLYLNSTAPNTLSRYQPAGSPASVTVTNSTPGIWSGNNPVALQLDNTIASASATLFLSAKSKQSRKIEARMFCSSNPAAYATSGIYALGTIPTLPTQYTFNLTTTAGGFSFPATCPTGDNWVLQVDNHTNNDVTVHPVSGGSFSRLNLDSSNVIYVENLNFYNAPYPGGVIITAATPGSTIYVRSVISDPFGSFDISSASIEISDPNGTPMLLPPPVTMPMANDSGAATKTFEYTYTLQAAPVAGNWDVRVTGNEGVEGLVADDLVGAFTVESLDLSLTKTVDNAAPAEGANVVYTLTINNPDATLTATGIQVTDLLLPANGLTYVSNTAPAPTTYDSATGIWNIGTLAPMSSLSLTLTAKTQFGSNGITLTNTATITAYDQYDDDLTNNSESVDIVPVAPPVLTIVKSADRANVNPGEVITYTITVTNTGGSPATTVQVSDALSPYIAMILDFDGTAPPYDAFAFADGGSGLTFNESTDLTYFDTKGPYVPDYAAGEDGAIVSWQLDMTGSFKPGSQFTLFFKVRVK